MGTFENVARKVVRGLEDGSIVLGLAESSPDVVIMGKELTPEESAMLNVASPKPMSLSPDKEYVDQNGVMVHEWFYTTDSIPTEFPPSANGIKRVSRCVLHRADGIYVVAIKDVGVVTPKATK